MPSRSTDPDRAALQGQGCRIYFLEPTTRRRRLEVAEEPRSPRRGRVMLSCVFLLALLAVRQNVCAYNPPVDEAGPLRVRIEGPEIVRELDQPVAIQVVIENRDPLALQGKVRVELIDRWTVQPSTPQPFQVSAQGKVTKTFHVTVGQGSYAAHYPIHAYVQFEHQQQLLTAHPILIVKAEVPTAPPESRLPWSLVSIRENSQLSLWQLPVRRAIVEVFGQQPQVMPVGWQGTEAGSRATLSFRGTVLSGQAMDGFVVHPPWYDGQTGTLLVEYPLHLPPDMPTSLRFANAVNPDGQSDGVTFRVARSAVGCPGGRSGASDPRATRAEPHVASNRSGPVIVCRPEDTSAAGISSRSGQQHGLGSKLLGRADADRRNAGCFTCLSTAD